MCVLSIVDSYYSNLRVYKNSLNEKILFKLFVFSLYKQIFIIVFVLFFQTMCHMDVNKHGYRFRENFICPILLLSIIYRIV